MRRTPRVLIVSNRLPLSRASAERGARWQSSPGGLVTAMTPVFRAHRGAWIGWTGTAGRVTRPFDHDGLRILPISLSRADVEDFYQGMSNKTLWPLYHDAIRSPEFHRSWWDAYVRVNRRFAARVAREARPSDLVWIHDYHLQLVPAMLRALRPGLRIGFFLHIPFPPEELFEWLPWRRQILEGLLGADVVGFQTGPAARNFSRSARQHTDADGTDSELEYEGRRVRVAAFPISIDFDWFESQAALPETAARAAEIRAGIGPERKVLLAVDRLDYTKGIRERLEAFEELLEDGAISAENCVLIQLGVPTRDAVPDYAELRTSVERVVGRINGTFSSPGRVAVHFFRRNLPREELVAYYAAADVMLVTPLRDGMNLVAKEYVATRSDLSGVLVLSEFAGAARELRRALIVNPRDLDQMKSTIARSLRLRPADARQRMAIMRTVVRRHDVHEWAGSFLSELRA